MNTDLFSAPSTLDFVDSLIAERNAMVRHISETSEFMKSPPAVASFGYFQTASSRSGFHGHGSMSFDPENAIQALDAAMWDKAITQIGVKDFFPAKRRDEWNKSIHDMTSPEFVESNVRPTLQDLLNSRMDFLAEMVDGIFRGLSGEHVTNRPEGFSKRMIMRYVVTYYGDQDRLHDLRGVISKFTGAEVPPYGATRADIDRFMQYPGEWFEWDGGALRIRVYKKGTGHLEVHPDIAIRLNQILAHLYPAAIPEKYRKTRKHEKAKQDVTLVTNVISPQVRSEMRAHLSFDSIYKASLYRHHSFNKAMYSKINDVIQSIGGVETERGKWEFDYPAERILAGVIASGALPDVQSYQYYPTPDELSKRAVEWADIGIGDVCTEPSAGQGAIAKYMPEVMCIEASKLHAQILEAKGFYVINADCLSMPHDYDVCVMNPPYSEGRWRSHTEHMLSFIKPGGRLVAILPSSAKGKITSDKAKIEWSELLDRPFPGVSIDIVLMKAVGVC